MTTFDSTKDFLRVLLEGARSGRIQLPDFQRDWVWDDQHIRDLLTSVSQSYPIGAIMLLETGNPDVRFKARPIEGITLDHMQEPERFILDGQQRLTSLYQALVPDQPVSTLDARGKAIKRWYYIDMRKALDLEEDRETAMRAIPEDRQLKNFRGEVLEDYSSPELEYLADLFPLSRVFDPAGWRSG